MFEGKWKDFSDNVQSEFAIMRHDVEFSVKRAFDLALIENKFGMKSTYNFQVRCNAYNVYSPPNITKILKIKELGHEIGLHLYISNTAQHDWETVCQELNLQIDLLSKILDFEITRFSFHRPKAWMLENRDDTIQGYLNQYGKSFFEYSPAPSEIKYLADSRHEWGYGKPSDHVSKKKIQILIHPDEWTADGLDEENNFKALKAELCQDILDTFMSETPKNFKKYQGMI